MTARRWLRRPEGSNWGDFGDNDQVGRLNLITAERRRRGAAEIREGLAFALSLPLDYPGGEALWEGRKPPQLGSAMMNFAISAMRPDWTDVICDDFVQMHTQYSTQWDSLAHIGHSFDADGDGVDEIVYYNGYRAGTDIVGAEAPDGPCARALSIAEMADTGAQGRAVLIDLLSVFGPERRKVDFTGLMQAIEAQGAAVETGDFLLLHSGFDDLLLEMGGDPDGTRIAACGALLDGRDPRLLQWITDSGIVAICSDTPTVEWVDPQEQHICGRHALLPLHEHCLFKLGIHLGEFWRLGDLARWLHAHDRSACFLTAPALRLPGSVGSPVTPVATV